MNNLKCDNSKVKAKQFERIASGYLATAIGTFFTAPYVYQKGVIDCPAVIRELLPDECEAMTKRFADALKES